MPPLLFYFLAAFGLAYILGHARISLGARTFFAMRGGLWQWAVELVECPACLGFWEGLAFGAAVPEVVPFQAPVPLSALALGLSTCAVGFLLGRLTGWLRED